MSAKPFTIERTYKAPVERVWKAITDKEAMKQWYFELSDFKPEVGFEFSFTGKAEDFEYNHLCRITEVTPLHKLQYTWSYEGYKGETVVTFELFEEGDKTRLKLTHEGLDNLEKIPAFAPENFAGGWLQIIGTSLLLFVEEDTLQKAVTIEATPEKVWHVITDPAQIKAWAAAFFEGTYAESDFKQGAILEWKALGHGTMVKGVIERFDAPKAFHIQYWDDPSCGPTDVKGRYAEHFDLEPKDDKTVLRVMAGPLSRMYAQDHEPLWDEALQNIKALAEA